MSNYNHSRFKMFSEIKKGKYIYTFKPIGNVVFAELGNVIRISRYNKSGVDPYTAEKSIKANIKYTERFQKFLLN